MYRITARQILVIALGSALFASVAVLGFQKLSQRFYPSGSALTVSSPENVSDPATVTDEQNNIEVYKAVSPGVVYIQSTTMVRDFFGLCGRARGRRLGFSDRRARSHPDELSRDRRRAAAVTFISAAAETIQLP